MYLLNDKIAQASKEINHLVIGETDRRTLWDRVSPIVQSVRDYYRAESRLDIAARVDYARRNSEKASFEKLARSCATVRKFILEMQTLTGFSALDIYAPELASFRVTGMDGQPTYLNADAINEREDKNGFKAGLRQILQDMYARDEIDIFIESTFSYYLSPMVPDVVERVVNAAKELKVWQFERPDNHDILASGNFVQEPLYDKLYAIAERRANDPKKPREGMLKLLNGEVDSALALRGTLGSFVRVVIKEYAKSHYFLGLQMERTRRSAQKEYVYHTAGETMLVQRKDGERPGMASGMDSGFDMLERLDDADRRNYSELEDFIDVVLDAWAPFVCRLNLLPIEWDSNGTPTDRLTESKLNSLLIRSSEEFGEWLRDQDRVQDRHDERVAQRMAARDAVAAATSVDDIANDLM